MYFKVAINIILLILLAVFQIAFVSALPGFLNRINFVIIILVFILSFSNFNLCLLWSIGCGIMFDIYSFSFFGTYLFLFVFVMSLANFLLINFFTNRSLYSLIALFVFSSSMFKFLLYFSNFILNFFEIRDRYILNSFSDALKAFIFETLLLIVLFYAFTYISKNSKSVFLLKYKN